MDENKKDISKTVGVFFQWNINKYEYHQGHTSEAFKIEGIPDVKWFIQFFPQCEYEVQFEEGDFIQFHLCNENLSEYSFKNPVKIEILLGQIPNTRIFSIITRNLSTFKNSIRTHKFNKLLTPAVHNVNCPRCATNINSLLVTLKIKPLKSEKEPVDLASTLTSCNNFSSFLLNDILSDFVFKFEDKEFPAHKIVLASVSPVFEKMFSHQMKENITNKVQVTDADPDVFKEMLNYIYTGKVQNLKTMAFGLYELANKYDISKLRQVSEQCLEESLTVENVVSVFELADRYNSASLKSKCIEYVDENFATVKETEPFKDIGKDLLMQLFCAIQVKTTQAS